MTSVQDIIPLVCPEEKFLNMRGRAETKEKTEIFKLRDEDIRKMYQDALKGCIEQI